MPDPTLGMPEQQSVFHIIIEAILAFLATGFTTVFGWVWVTDQSVRSLIQTVEDQTKQNEKYRLEREKQELSDKDNHKTWRQDIKEMIEKLAEEIENIKLELAEQRGADGRQVRTTPAKRKPRNRRAS